MHYYYCYYYYYYYYSQGHSKTKGRVKGMELGLSHKSRTSLEEKNYFSKKLFFHPAAIHTSILPVMTTTL